MEELKELIRAIGKVIMDSPLKATIVTVRDVEKAYALLRNVEDEHQMRIDNLEARIEKIKQEADNEACPLPDAPENEVENESD